MVAGARRIWARRVGPSAVVALGLIAHYAGNALALLVLARRVLPLEFGQFTAVVALVAATVALPAFGLDTWLLARGAVTPPTLAAIWRQTLTLRIALLLLWAVGLGMVSRLLPPATYPGGVLAGVMAAAALESIALMTLAALRSGQEHGRVALVQASWAGGILLLALLLPLTPGRLIWFTTARAGVAAVAAALLVRMMRGRPAAPTGPTWSELLHAGRPFLLSDVATLLYLRGDLLLVGLLLGARAAAIYGPAISVLGLAYILPTALFYAATPALSHLRGATGQDSVPDSRQEADPASVTAGNAFRVASRRQLVRQAGLGLLLAAGLWLGAPLVTYVYGPGYGAVGGVLRLLAPIGLLRALNFGFGAILIADGRQAVRTRIQLAVALVAVVGNLVVIPWLGVMGVAGVFVLCELLLALGYGWSTRAIWANRIDT
jgi:O-antigen/teichoic acid export membrane protein